MPELLIDAQKLRENFKIIEAKLSETGTRAAYVTKIAAGHHSVINILYQAGCRYFAESRIVNFKNYPREILADPQVKRLLICLPYPEIVEEVVRYATISLNSELDTMAALNQASRRQRQADPLLPRHQVIIMVEGGDRREGIMPAKLPSLVKKVVQDFTDLEFVGIGCNFNCLGGIISDQEKMLVLSDLAAELTGLGYPCPVVSGGNSGTWHMVDQRTLPAGITEVRLGEILHNGREPSFGRTMPYLHDDVYQLSASVIEIGSKPYQSQGRRFYNISGELDSFTQDRGDIRRMLVACGGQDIGYGSITPVNPELVHLGHSGDHTLLEIKRGDYQIGDKILFKLDYVATNTCFNTHQVTKTIVNG